MTIFRRLGPKGFLTLSTAVGENATNDLFQQLDPRL